MTIFTLCESRGLEMKIYERWLQDLLSSAPRSRVLARFASLAQIGELARRLTKYVIIIYVLGSVRKVRRLNQSCSKVAPKAKFSARLDEKNG